MGTKKDLCFDEREKEMMQKRDIKVSVILPALNVADYIDRCIQSILKQTLQDIEIIAVDAGSDDGTLEILKKYEKIDQRLSVIHSNRKSYGYQVNLGIRNSSGKYIGIVETDDYIEAGMYEELYKIANANDLDFIKGNFYRFLVNDYGIEDYYPSSVFKDETKGTYGKVLYSEAEYLLHNTNTYIWSGIYKRSFLTSNSILLNETEGASYQDNSFWFITTALAEKTLFCNKYFYNLRRDNLNSSVFNKKKVFCIFDEYDYAYRFLTNNKKLFDRLIGSFWEAAFNNYLFSFYRISDEYKKVFLQRFSEVFNRAEERHEINWELFSENQIRILKKIMENPSSFLLDTKLREKDKNHLSIFDRFRFCYEDNGLMHTLLLIPEKLISYIKKEK